MSQAYIRRLEVVNRGFRYDRKHSFTEHEAQLTVTVVTTPISPFELWTRRYLHPQTPTSDSYSSSSAQTILVFQQKSMTNVFPSRNSNPT